MTKVIITDDAAFMRMTLRNIITNAGFEVVAEAVNGIEAVKLYEKHRPDLVTMDITMPEMSGIDALIEIKKIDPEAKVIMCSAVGQQTKVIDAIQYGAADFILKPFDESRIIETIEKTLNIKSTIL
ncbi:response regulator [Evansella sp. AB-P1]|uniref:response regulator n=1 Tax=Evansella sp. AB-P1 TaxID=3037653 RepID=UPI00241FB1C3|nr:response regulator [Evansella sp. AB-P1]MDG5787410.1 response regulator [Evansella sp. AB-P1]